jgi:alpha/beta superfamily hydrolase|tara:strand:- start:433 stop:1074 length:642 start_codon:yes stop_codon:yes gene_type:complete
MSKSPYSERLFIAGPAGRLEAILELSAEHSPLGSVVVCHPHPQHGGTMHNKVAHTLARAFVQLGYAALRFNFRGIENSEGEYDEGMGELDDALAAISWMRARDPGARLWLAGFSFGAAIAVDAAVDTAVDGLVSVAPAITRYASGPLAQPECPWLIVQGDQDELVDVEKTVEWVNGLLPGPELLIISGAEHFFHGRLVELREAVAEFVVESQA